MNRSISCAMAAGLGAGLALGGVAAVRASDCTVTSVGFTPLTDLGSGLYLGQFQGGLYPGGSNAVPAAHAAMGQSRAAGIGPLDTSGNASPTGKFVLLSIGMSNTTQEYCSQGSSLPCDSWSFMGQAAANPLVNHFTLAMVNGAAGGQTASTWDSPADTNYDRVRDTRLIPQGLSEAQVVAVWLKLADAQPTVSLPSSNADAYVLEGLTGNVLRAIKTRYPNCRLVFISSRIYAGYAGYPTPQSTLNPEPYSYESGFAMKWLIEAQINQMAGGGVDPVAGDLNYNAAVPWIAWGAYLWADGTTPRSDGLQWFCTDLVSDGTHPSAPSGRQKVGTMLLNFMLNSPFTVPWFKRCAAADMNADGRRDGKDIPTFIATLLNPPSATDAQRCAADCNGDGSVAVTDIPYFVNLLLAG